MRNPASTHSHTVRLYLAAALLSLGLAGCGTTNWGFPYRATIQQGNWITSEQIAQLEVGMTRDQVRFILGSPTLQDAFHADRWDYPYYNQPGYGKKELRKFTVWFQDDRLTRWSGDEQPDRQPFQKVDSGAEAVSPDHPAGTPTTPPAAPAPEGHSTPAAPAAQDNPTQAVPGQDHPASTGASPSEPAAPAASDSPAAAPGSGAAPQSTGVKP